MTEPTALGDLELAALVSSRICHDVINPVSAISNGLEMLAEEPDEAMREAAMDLIRKSAAQASAKLQFARLALGAAGSAGADRSARRREGGPRIPGGERQAPGHLAGTCGDAAQEQGQAAAQPGGARRGRVAAWWRGQCRD